MNKFLELLIEVAQQLEAFGLGQKNLIRVVVFLSILMVGNRLQIDKIVKDYPNVRTSKLNKNVDKLLTVNILFYGVLNLLVYVIFDWLNKIFSEFILQTIILATLTIILILNQSELLVNNQLNSTKKAIKSTDESIETINKFLGCLNLNTFQPIRSLVQFLLFFYGVLYTPLYHEILNVCSRIEEENINKAKQQIIEKERQIDRLLQTYQSLPSDQDKLHKICSDIKHKLTLFEPRNQDEFWLKQKLENGYQAMVDEITRTSDSDIRKNIYSALIFLEKLSE